MDIEYIARQLGGARKSGNDWSCRCPAHDDNRSSLSIVNKEGKLLVCCHAGCDQLDVIQSIKNLGLWPDGVARNTPTNAPAPVKISLGSGRGQIVATYDYTDENGELLYQAVRYEPKDFRQRKPEGAGWNWSIKGVRRVLYRLNDVIQAVAQGQIIYVCEGEKDVEAARAIGLVATCNAMGADNGSGNKWLPEFAEYLVNADVVVIPDNDEAGQRHANWVIQSLAGKARNIGRINVPVGKDLADWIAAGATVGEIEGAIVDAIEVDLPPPKEDELKQPFAFADVSDLVSDIRPIQWLVRDFFERDSLALVYGAPGGGKSFFSVDIACSIATGTPWMSHDVHQGTVFYIAGEGHNGLARRFKAWETARQVPIAQGQIFKSCEAMQALDEDNVISVAEQIEAISKKSGMAPSMVVIDTLARNFGSGNENDTKDMNTFVSHLDRHIRSKFQCCVLVVHHSGHNAERARGSSALKAALDAEYEISKDDGGVIRLRTTKMKDAELPDELTLKLSSVELPGVLDEDGEPVTSAVLESAGDLLDTVIGNSPNKKVQVRAKDALLVLHKNGFMSDRDLGAELSLSRRQGENMLKALERYKLINRELKVITEEGKAALSRIGSELKRTSMPGTPVWKRKDLDD